MDDLITKLEDYSHQTPNDSTLNRLLDSLTALRRDGPSATSQATWDAIRADAQALKERHVLKDDEIDLGKLEQLMPPGRTNDSRPVRDISIVVPPNPHDPSVSRLPINPATLPAELLETITQTYFLHQLATEPASVLPPGKSLLSAMIGSGAEREAGSDATPTLHERVEDIVHKAFWSEATETLSDPLPATQLTRLKGLYHDLRDTIHPLLPPQHPALLTLTLPLSPTNAPLRSALLHLRETAAALRERCAPARDAALDAVLAHIVDPPAHAPAAELAPVVVRAVREILAVAEVMKSDLRGFVLGRTGEAELVEAVRADAREKERAVVSEVWGKGAVRDSWKAWVEELVPRQASLQSDSSKHRRRWVARLVQALGSTSAVGCLLPSHPPTSTSNGSTYSATSPSSDTEPKQNALPPTLFFVTPTLLHIQNFLQALTIAAALRSLTRLPPPSPTTPSSDFMERIWTLLHAEVERDEGTKLINLADEVVRARRLASASTAPSPEPTTSAELSKDEEERLRAAVDRTLKPADPVFALLHKRLLDALLAALDKPAATDESARVPEQMRTGRERPGKRPRLELSREREDTKARLVVKGFEDEVLVRGVSEALRKVRGVIEWTQTTWADIVEESERAEAH